MPNRWRRVTSVVLALAALVVVTALFSLLPTVAGFTDATGNTGNSWTADTLDPPTALAAAGGAIVTLTWIATPDTYATGHRILRSTSPGGPYTQIAEIAPRTTVAYIDSPATVVPTTTSFGPITATGRA